jgi:hypothetical protein
LAIIDNDEPPGTRVAMVPEPESQAGICAACPCLRSLYIHHAKADLSVHHVRQLIELTVLRGTLRLCPPTPASGEADDDGLELQGLTLGAAAHIPSLASWKLYNLYYLSVESDRHLLQVAECESLPEGMYDEQQASVVASLTVILLPSFRWTRPSRKLRRQEAARFPVGLHRLRLMPGVSTAHLLSLLQFFPSIHTLELVEPEPWLELAVTPYPIHTLILQRPSPTQSTTAWAANLHYEELVVCT